MHLVFALLCLFTWVCWLICCFCCSYCLLCWFVVFTSYALTFDGRVVFSSIIGCCLVAMLCLCSFVDGVRCCVLFAFAWIFVLSAACYLLLFDLG